MAPLVRRLHAILTGTSSPPTDESLPFEVRGAQAGNFVKHVATLTSTRIADGLADPKLVLPWLLGSLGAPPAAIGWLVPIREAGALLPQLVVAARIRALRYRKYAWSIGALVQGFTLAAMAFAAWTLRGDAIAWAVLGLLALFAIARSVCSVTYRDVLGKTVVRSNRGTVVGTAATIASASVLAFGSALALGLLPTELPVVVAALAIAAALWLCAATIYSMLVEHASEGATHRSGIRVAFDHLSLLRTERQLRRLILIRGLLVASAIAPPFLLQLRPDSRDAASVFAFGPFVVAAALASVVSSYVWGRRSDRSSRRVLIHAGGICAIALATTAGAALASPSIAAGTGVLPALLFVLMVGYQGVRVGRATHLVDMAEESTRAAYTALSNTVIGIVLALTGTFGLLVEPIGAAGVLAIFAAMCAAAAVLAIGLEEVQRQD